MTPGANYCRRDIYCDGSVCVCVCEPETSSKSMKEWRVLRNASIVVNFAKFVERYVFETRTTSARGCAYIGADFSFNEHVLYEACLTVVSMEFSSL